MNDTDMEHRSKVSHGEKGELQEPKSMTPFTFSVSHKDVKTMTKRKKEKHWICLRTSDWCCMCMNTNVCTEIRNASLIWLADEPATPNRDGSTRVCRRKHYVATGEGGRCKMEFRLSDAGRLMEAGVGSKAEDVSDGQAGGVEGRLSSPPLVLFIQDLCTHTHTHSVLSQYRLFSYFFK